MNPYSDKEDSNSFSGFSDSNNADGNLTLVLNLGKNEIYVFFLLSFYEVWFYKEL